MPCKCWDFSVRYVKTIEHMLKEFPAEESQQNQEADAGFPPTWTAEDDSLVQLVCLHEMLQLGQSVHQVTDSVEE